MTRAAPLVGVLLVAGCASAAAPRTDGPLPGETVVRIAAKRFEFVPSEIHLKAGAPAVIELTSLDVRHGFEVSDLHVDTEIEPGRPTFIRFTPERPGAYPFHCSVFCGEGHESMGGRIIVEP